MIEEIKDICEQLPMKRIVIASGICLMIQAVVMTIVVATL